MKQDPGYGCAECLNSDSGPRHSHCCLLGHNNDDIDTPAKAEECQHFEPAYWGSFGGTSAQVWLNPYVEYEGENECVQLCIGAALCAFEQNEQNGDSYLEVHVCDLDKLVLALTKLLDWHKTKLFKKKER